MLYIVDRSWENATMNLAYEYCLLNKISECETAKEVLYLWQNRDTVVIGRNQNPYKECDMGFIKKEGIELVRRMTGGGAVYHDFGNLNYSFICKERLYDREKIFGYMVEALNSLGISCQATGRNDITANGVKISGNAFYQLDQAILHHGTIMVNVNTDRMGSCLTPNKAKLKSKGVSSVQQRVGNLINMKGDISVSQVKAAVSFVFCKYLDVVDDPMEIDEKLFLSTYESLSSRQWVFGNYSEDYEMISGIFEWGTIELRFVLKGDIVDKCLIETDCLYPEAINKVTMYLEGKRLEDIVLYKEEFCQNHKLEKKEMIYKDIVSLICEKLINK